MLFPREAWWTALFQAAPARYCDVSTPAKWSHPGEVVTVDLDLDVCRIREDGSVFVDDEDEFTLHQVRYGYPSNVVARTEAASEWLSAALHERTEPLGSRYHEWLDNLPAIEGPSEPRRSR
ncbi:hypothetical protein GCM10023317_09730 [Actinopolymorpha pittospori]